MQYIYKYQSPIGGITIASDGSSLTGLWFDGQKYFAASLSPEHEEKVLPVFEQTIEWLDCYFSGKNPGFMSTQAVGNAVGHNPISIIIPCHRVVSCNGSLTGYAGGISKKIELLTLEQVDMTNLFVPKKGTTL